MKKGEDTGKWQEFLSSVHCPRCEASVVLHPPSLQTAAPQLRCEKCGTFFPIIQGIPILVEKPFDYLLEHAKGVGRVATPAEIPKAIRRDFESIVKETSPNGFMEDDLEAKRVVALYVATHFLTAKDIGEKTKSVFQKTLQENWDQGFWREVQAVTERLTCEHRGNRLRVVELGCGVGGVARFFGGRDSFYLGIDTSFTSLHVAKRIYDSAEYKFRLSGELLQGELSREKRVIVPPSRGNVFFCVADIENAPLKGKFFDGSVSLNTIDMLDAPEKLPQIQSGCVRPGGWILAASPFIWQPKIAQALRKKFKSTSSGEFFREVYERAGIEIQEVKEHLPWVFYKHERQLEMYSVDMLLGLNRSRASQKI